MLVVSGSMISFTAFPYPYKYNEHPYQITDAVISSFGSSCTKPNTGTYIIDQRFAVQKWETQVDTRDSTIQCNVASPESEISY